MGLAWRSPADYDSSNGWRKLSFVVQGISPLGRKDWELLESGRSSHFALFFLVVSGVLSLLSPAPATAQEVAREALALFPADTQQIAYANLVQLRTSPNYPRLRERLFSRQLRDFQDFFRSMGTDPEKDVDEVVLGWRGEPENLSTNFGLAQGRFQPDKVREFFASSQLPRQRYQEFDLYAFGSGEGLSDIYFTFPSSSSAIFGRLGDVKALLDVRVGSQPALDSNPLFVSSEEELDGTAPQWGISSARSAANQAAPWLGSGKKQAPDLNSLVGPVQAVLYRLEWENGFSVEMSILCKDADSANALAKVLSLVKAARPTETSASVMDTVIQAMDVQANGSRVELRGSGPLEAMDQVLSSAFPGQPQ